MPSRPGSGAAVLLVVAVGGVAGALCRYLVTEAFPDPPDGFPWAVFAINVAGSALLAALPALPGVRRQPLLPPLLGSGVLGGFTTLSAYSEQTRALLAGGHVVTATAYVAGTLAACLLIVAAVDRLTSPTERTDAASAEGNR